MKRKVSIQPILMVLIFMNFTMGCYYYRVNTRTDVTPVDIRWQGINGKYIILHSGDSAWHVDNIWVDTVQFSGEIHPLPANHRMYLKTDPQKNNRFIKKNPQNYEGDVINEVHLYVRSLERNDSLVSFPFHAMDKMEVYEFASGPTAASHVAGAIAIPVVIASVVAIVIAATKSSCPYVYVQKGEHYDFAGEIYSGAIFASLERDDYLPLPSLESSEGILRVKVANELPEVQYLNQLELWSIEKPNDAGVLVDKYGIPHTIGVLNPPVSAVTSHGTDQLPGIRDKDTQCFLFDEVPLSDENKAALNSLEMKFNVPDGLKQGKLVITAKNSFWVDYVFGEFAKKFGSSYGHWIQYKGKKPPDQSMQWKKDQALPLMVYLKTADGWQFLDYFDMAGPLAYRDMILPVDLPDDQLPKSQGGNELTLRLESGFMFWELDYAAMDFSPDIPVEILYQKPVSAVNEKGKDVKKPLLDNDNKYYIQEKTGNEVVLEFFNPENRHDSYSLFLHARGYYEHIRQFNGKPQMDELLTFRAPAKFSEFSYQRYLAEKSKYSSWLSSHGSK